MGKGNGELRMGNGEQMIRNEKLRMVNGYWEMRKGK